MHAFPLGIRPDENGICWPMAIAPFQVLICALDMREEAVTTLAQKLHDEMAAAGIEVLLDDRDERPGFKFNDADLIGIPLRVTVGKRGIADGTVELRTRRSGEVQKIAPEHVAGKVHELVASMVDEERTPVPKR